MTPLLTWVVIPLVCTQVRFTELHILGLCILWHIELHLSFRKCACLSKFLEERTKQTKTGDLEYAPMLRPGVLYRGLSVLLLCSYTG